MCYMLSPSSKSLTYISYPVIGGEMNYNKQMANSWQE